MKKKIVQIIRFKVFKSTGSYAPFQGKNQQDVVAVVIVIVVVVDLVLGLGLHPRNLHLKVGQNLLNNS